MSESINELLSKVEDLIANNKVDEALALSEQIVELYKDNDLGYFWRAKSKAILGIDDDEAISDYTKCIELNQNNYRAYNNRGLLKTHSANWEGSIEDYDKAISIKPDFDAPYFNKGRLYAEVYAKYDLAVENLTKGIELNDKEYMAYNYRGYSYYMLDEYEKALEDFDKAIEMVPNYGRSYYYRGLIRGMWNVYKNDGCICRLCCFGDKEIEDFTRAIELEPDWADSYSHRGGIYFVQQQYDLALKDWDKYIEIKPNDSHGYVNRAYVKHEMKDYEGAILDYTTAISNLAEDEDDGSVYYNRGLSKCEIGDYAGAKADYDLGNDISKGEFEELSQMLKSKIPEQYL